MKLSFYVIDTHQPQWYNSRKAFYEKPNVKSRMENELKISEGSFGGKLIQY